MWALCADGALYIAGDRARRMLSSAHTIHGTEKAHATRPTSKRDAVYSTKIVHFSVNVRNLLRRNLDDALHVNMNGMRPRTTIRRKCAASAFTRLSGIRIFLPPTDIDFGASYKMWGKPSVSYTVELDHGDHALFALPRTKWRSRRD